MMIVLLKDITNFTSYFCASQYLKLLLVGCCVGLGGLVSQEDGILFAGAYFIIKTKMYMLHFPVLVPPNLGPPIFFHFILMHIIVFTF